ncbi:MAG: hypothetical protein R3D34_18700 [Nitratireductor sp.]
MRRCPNCKCLYLLHGYPHLRPLRGCYYWESGEEHKVKYIKRIAEVTSDGKRLLVKGEDTLVKRPISIPFDMVGLCHRHGSNIDNMTLSAIFDIKLNKYGYVDKPSSYLHMAETSRPGVCGRTPDETIDDSIAQGNAAAIQGPQHASQPAQGGCRVMFSLLRRRDVVEERTGPVLDLSGPHCVALSSILLPPPKTPAVSSAMSELLPSRPHCSEEILGKGRVAQMSQDEFLDLAAFITPVRRRIAGWIGFDFNYAALHRRIIGLLEGWSDISNRCADEAHSQRAFHGTRTSLGP